MAGESPDRSKQHESSAEPTSGSGTAVPASAKAGGDPRLALAGEAVRVDQATAVFSLPRGSARTAVDEADPAFEGDGADKGSAGPGAKDAGPAKGTADGGRERASLASWVRTADEDEAGSEDTADDAREVSDPGAKSEAAEGGSGGAGETSTAKAGPEPAEETGNASSPKAARKPEVAAEGADAGDRDTAGSGSGGEDAEDRDTAGSGSGSGGEDVEGEAGTKSGGASGTEESAERGDEDAEDAEDAVWDEDSGSGGEDVEGEAGTKSGDASGTEETAEPGDEDAEDAEDAAGDEHAAGAEDADDEAEDAATPDAGTASGGSAAAVAGSAVSETEDEEAPEAESEDEDPDAAGTEGDGGSAAETGSKSGAGEGSTADAPFVDQPTAIFKMQRPAVDQPTTMLKLGGAKPADRDAGEAQSEASGKGEAAAAKPAVDQPTTMLKSGGAEPADKPSDKPTDEAEDEAAAGKPAVDQPTTMLKLGGAKPSAKPAGKTDKPASAEDQAEPADSERTSKFVALKPLDEPGPAKPKPALSPAEATTALPRVGPERTAQQPLPPKPPLDLLAELTNTPPPPETPVRTVLRRIKIWTPLAVLLLIIFAIVQAVRPLPAGSLALTADETYTFGGGKLDLPWPGQGQSAIEVQGVGVIGTEGSQSPKPIASVAKIMTAYVTLQEHPLKGNEDGPTITADQQAEDESKNEDESTAAMKKGQKFSERQMLQMLMIPSGNNAARLLARWDSDNKTFVGKMNAAAKKLGMTKSTYTDPSGLDKTTVSTAVDQIKLAKAVMQNEVFRGVVGMAKAEIPGLDQPIYNTNDLLVTQVGVIGLKTGSSTPAGGNLVWAATKVVDGKTQTVYGAVLNQDAHKGTVWWSLKLALDNSQKLIDKVQQSLTTATVVKKGQVVGYVDDQLGGRTPVVATKNMTAVGWPGLKTGISISDGGKAIPHEAKAGTVVGELKVGDGSSHAVTIPVAVQKDLTEPGYGAKFTRLG
ncbi:D-alanyl-D-alanine carboxypeptidase [Streptomyces sp. NPDC046900]|uniref:D-alanyl-D-alanine carboxypeptidase n=1 Tax=Streptomyces sp. NPDC046900 TaxID=3155473 RepID=UPI00340064B6